MSAHALLNLLNELGRRDKIQKEIKFFFATSLLNSIILDSIYHMTLELL